MLTKGMVERLRQQILTEGLEPLTVANPLINLSIDEFPARLVSGLNLGQLLKFAD